jgi:hypothetical protein
MDMGTLDSTVLEPTEDLDQLDDQLVDDTPDDSEPEPIGDKPDGRKFNKEWADEFKNLKALYPDKAKMLDDWRDRIGRFGTISELAPKGVDDIRNWKTTVDALGGAEKAAELMQQAAEYEQIDSRIESGDFSVVAELPESMQKGFYEMLPQALTSLEEKNPSQFSAIVAPHFRAALAGTGMGEHLQTMYAKADGNPELQELIRQQYNWFQQQTKGAGAMPGVQKTVDPQVQRLQAELSNRENADKESFNNSIGSTAIAYKDEQFTKLAAPYIKQLGLTEAQQGDLKDSYTAKIVAALSGDSAFQAQLKAYGALKTRDAGQINAYVQANVDKYAKQVLDGLVTARYSGVRQKKVTSVTSGGTTDSGAVRVAQAPAQDQWDMAKMESLGYENTVKQGIFHLQGGRTVKLVKQ